MQQPARKKISDLVRNGFAKLRKHFRLSTKWICKTAKARKMPAQNALALVQKNKLGVADAIPM